MSRPIIDAGPALNFLAANQINLVIKSMGGPLSTPETVAKEILQKSRTDSLFDRAAMEKRWKTLTSKDWIEVLLDEGDDLNAICARIERQPLELRKRHAKDLGELMVVIHAVRAAEQGYDVKVLIDDTEGAKLAERERRRIALARTTGSRGFGSITLVSSLTILRKQAGTDLIPDRAKMREIYAKLSPFDAGLPTSIRSTDLLDPQWW